MYRSKLLEIIRAFDDNTLADCQLFLNSPYFQSKSTQEYNKTLFSLIHSVAPNFEDSGLSKEAAFKVLFPGKLFQKGRVEKVMSSLLKELYRFLSYQEIKKEESHIEFELKRAIFFRNNNLEKYYEKSLKQIRTRQDGKKTIDINYFFHQYLIEKEKSYYAALNNSRTEALNIPATIKSLDTFYLVEKMEYSCWLLAQNQNRPAEEQQSISEAEEELFKLIGENNFQEEPLIKAYFLAYSLLKTNEESVFKELQQHLEKFETQIPILKQKAFHTYCRNYCIAQYNANETEELLKKAFQLYKTHLKKGFLFYQGGLLPSTIKNLVVKGLTLNEHEWVYEFLQQTKEKIIGTNHPLDVYNFNMAWYYFALQKYEQALELLRDSYEDVYYKVAAKRLEVMIRFEQKSILTDNRLDAFKIYIFRLGKKSISKLQKEGNNNFC